MTNRRKILGVVLSIACAWVAGCNGILGIDDADIDPTFHPDANAGGVGSTCARYCDTIMTNCKEANQQYLSKDICLAMCPAFESGKEGATDGNNLACRIAHTEKAATDPVTHCPHAGPLGHSVCGEACQGFCLLVASQCKSPSPYPDGGENECLASCAGYAFASKAGDLGLDHGDTLNCRLFHLESAYTPGLATFHCPHTAKVSEKCFGASDAGLDARHDG